MATFAASFKPCNNNGAIFPDAGKSPQGIHETSATQNYPLGTRIVAKDPVLGEAEFIYCKGVAATAVGNGVVIENDFTTALDATPKGLVGVAMSACVANQFGWYCVKGRVPGLIAADFTAGGAYMSAAAGTWQSTAIAGSHVLGASGATGLDAGGSAIAGTTDTTAQHFVILTLQYPYGAQAV